MDPLDRLPRPADRRLAARVTADAIRHVRSGHPWVFGDSIVHITADGAAGDLAVIFDSARKFVAIGLYDPASPIRIRVLHHGQPGADRRCLVGGPARRRARPPHRARGFDGHDRLPLHQRRERRLPRSRARPLRRVVRAQALFDRMAAAPADARRAAPAPPRAGRADPPAQPRGATQPDVRPR